MGGKPRIEATSRRGALVIISSPSGAGKTTLSRQLLAEFSDSLEFSVSFTTRPPRVGEVDGLDYHFVSVAEFERMVADDEFAEWAQVHGNRYGTSRKVVEGALSSGTDVVFDVDWQGGRRLSAQWPTDALMIFILPPDLDTLEERLRRRATDAPDVIQRRLRMAIEELRHHDEYQHHIVNDDLDVAYSALRAVYLVRRMGESAPDELVHLMRANSTDSGARHARRLIEERPD